MSHAVRNSKRLIHRIRRIRGQVNAIERALEGGLACDQVLQRITACRGAIDGLLSQVLKDHVRFHIIEGSRHKGADPRDAGREILSVIEMYLR